MPFFQYTATDKNGRQVNGTLQAATPDAAMQALRGAGLSTVDVRAPKAQAVAQQRPATAPPRQSAPSVNRPIHQAARPIAIPAPTAAQPVKRTARSSDKERFFLFSQLAAIYRAGINPAQGINDIARRTNNVFTESLHDMSAAAGEGIPLSTVMKRYPDLFPSHVAAVTEAGEMAGFMPEAFEEISRQAEVAHKFGRWFIWVWFVVINALVSIPLIILTTRAMLLSWEKIDKQGGGDASLNWALGVIGRSFGEKILWPIGPLILLMWICLYFGRRYIRSNRMLVFRHRLGLKYPVFGARARQESFARFSWTLSYLSRAGIAPASAWRIAAESVPNLAMRDILLHGGNWMQGSERLSDIIAKSRVFPEEYAPMVANAELTGDVPGAMDRLSKMSHSEFETATNYAKVRSGVWGCLGMFVTSGIVLAILFYFWYHELTGAVLKGME
jgi:type II secretory pathway component PulF